jgi:hypothetical protein
MAFTETVYLHLSGGIVQPISKVTAQLAPSNVVIYNGETYRDNPVDLLYTPNTTTLTQTYVGSNAVVAAGLSDLVSHTAPRYKGLQVTLWTFAREVTTGVAGFSHVVWAHLVESTGDYPAYRMGATAPTIV